MPDRQQLIDAILELTREESAHMFCFTYLLLHADTQFLGEVFDACADYDDVRHRAGRTRGSAVRPIH